jgi:hypothetical protein
MLLRPSSIILGSTLELQRLYKRRALSILLLEIWVFIREMGDARVLRELEG